MVHPSAGIALVLAILALSLVCLSSLTRRLHPEVVRKALHVGMGSVTLSFPWLFDQTWPVLVLAGLATVFFVALRTCETLRRGAGRTLYCVERDSLGEIHFALGMALTFVLAAGHALMFFIPMLVLTLADPAAALAGVSFARHRFVIGSARKSIEGSVAFFLVALPCIFLPLLLVASRDVSACLAIAVLAAFAATVSEAIAGGGWDNVTVPLGVFAALGASGVLGDHSVLGVNGAISALLLIVIASVASSRLRVDRAAR